MDKKKYPLSVLEDWSNILQQLREKAKSNNALLSVIQNNADFFKVADHDQVFSYQISNPMFYKENGQTLFSITYCPRDRQSIEEYSSNIFAKDVMANFEKWLLTINQYETIILTEEEEFAKYYEKEFSDEYELNDEDAETHPFEHSRQIAIYNLLTYIEKKIEQQENITDPNVTAVIEEVEELKNNIQNYTKKKVVQRLSKIFAVIKMRGLKVFTFIISKGTKTAVKKLVEGGIDYVQHNWHHHTP